jgi:hypothetical protein
MVPEIFGKPCVADDCNLNDVPDASDISGGGSLDANSNGVPDECEDCNRNNVLDDADILGASQDLNANGVPDECEPDCNGNNVPDDQDIAQGSDTDLYGNGVPDGCETDCDGSTVSDYNEIQADLSVDLDRNAVLDVCQDCDGNGTNDVAALGGAHDLWIASGVDPAPLRRFHAAVGSLTATGGGGPAGVVRGGQDVLTLPDQRVLVSSFADDRVLAFGDDGAFLGDFVAPGSGGLDGPTGLALSPAGSVLVASYNNNRVLAYNAKTGAPLGAFVAPGAGGLVKPFGLTFRPGGDLYIAGGDNRVRQYNRNSGSFVRVLVPASSGGLFDPRGLTFKPDGHLVVTSNASDQVLEYEGATGLFIGAFTHVGTGTVLNQTSPWGVRVGPNGSLYVSRTGEPGGDGDGHDHDHGGGGELHLSNAQVYEFDIATGNFLRVLVGGNDHGLIFPTGFDFVPGWAADCNLNLLQDDCDIAAGTSADADADGIPDECQVDCNSNGIQDRLDVIPYGEDLDCNYNLRPDPCDIAADPALDVNANGLIDGCECVSAGSCADADHDGRRDDGCLWWSCQTGTCNSLAVTFADVGGVFGDCHPDGVVDGNDRFHALDCFANVSAEGTMPYPCEAAAPRAYNVDAGGMFGNCVPDGVCDGHDVFHVLSVFEGISLCSCGGAAPAAAPPGGAQKKRPPPILPEAVLQLRASRNRLTAGQNVAVDVRLGSAVPDLRAFQLHLGVSGGTSGSLELVDIFIREPSVFSPAAKESDLAPRAPRYERGAASDERRAVSDERPSLNPPSFWSAFNTSTHQVLAGVDGPGVAVPAGAYLATFVFQATRDAAGTFAVEILADTADPAQRTFLFTSPTAAPRAVAPPAPALVTVESRDMQTFSP